MKSPQQVALELIAGIGPGLEQDIAYLEENWPKSRRGSRAQHAWEKILSRARTAIATAREQIEEGAPSPPRPSTGGGVGEPPRHLIVDKRDLELAVSLIGAGMSVRRELREAGFDPTEIIHATVRIDGSIEFTQEDGS